MFLLIVPSVGLATSGGSGGSTSSCKKLKLRLQPSTYHFDLNPIVHLNLLVEVPYGQGGDSRPETCSFFVGFGYGRGGRPEARQLKGSKESLPIQFWRDSQRNQILKDPPEANTNQEVFAGTLNLRESQQISFSYVAELMLTNLPLAGEYKDQFSIHLYEGTLQGRHSLIDSNILNLHFHQQRMAHVSLVDNGAPFDKNDQSQVFDYGELQQGESKSCDIVVIYNAGMRLWLLSTHRGNLQKKNNKKYEIPYLTRINGNNIQWPASGTIKLDSRSGRSAPGGLRYTLDATIGSLGQAPSGEYSDEILVRIESQE